MSNRITTKTCEFCGKSFEAKKCDSKYCSPTCRKYAYIEREKRITGWPVPATYTSFKFKQPKDDVYKSILDSTMGDIKSIMEQELRKLKK